MDPRGARAEGRSDAVGGAYLTVEQASKHRRLCGYCLISAAANVAAASQTIAEARAALQR